MKRKGFVCALLLVLCLLALAPGGVRADSGGTQYIYDVARVLSEADWTELERQAEAVSEAYDCGVYVVIVEDYRDYTDGGNVEQAAQEIYLANGFGLTDEKSGILLLMSMDGRDYDLVAYGYGNVAFTDYGKAVLEEEFLDDFRRNDWYNGFLDYISVSGELLARARNGSPLDNAYGPEASRSLREEIGVPAILLIAIVVGCLVALVACSIMKASMKSVAIAQTAERYAVPNSLDLYESNDNFTHVTESRVRVESDSDRDSGGGGTSVNSDGFSHSSGKF